MAALSGLQLSNVQRNNSAGYDRLLLEIIPTQARPGARLTLHHLLTTDRFPVTDELIRTIGRACVRLDNRFHPHDWIRKGGARRCVWSGAPIRDLPTSQEGNRAQLYACDECSMERRVCILVGRLAGRRDVSLAVPLRNEYRSGEPGTTRYWMLPARTNGEDDEGVSEREDTAPKPAEEPRRTAVRKRKTRKGREGRRLRERGRERGR